jgi:hypothetical protein
MANDQYFVVLNDREHGNEGKYYDRKWPTLRADGSLWTSPEDGDVLGPFPVRANIQYTTAFPGNMESFEAIGRALRNRETVYRLFHFQMFVTESRVVLVQNKPPAEGHQIVGHLRFPWITSVGFRPKQSLLNECTLELKFQESMDDGDGGVWFHDVELTFEKTFDSGSLAQTIVRRMAAHHLRLELPDVVTTDVRELLAVERLPNPAKGELSEYFSPVFVYFPYGAEYIGDDVEKAAWFGPKLTESGM